MLMRYLSQENAGDFFLGRVVAGLPQETKKFAVLPPRFKFELTAEQVAILNQIYVSCFPNDTKWGMGMRPVFRHLLATIAYHKDYLQALPESHPFRATWLSMNPAAFNALNEMVELKYDGDDDTCRFSFFRHIFSATFFRHIFPPHFFRHMQGTGHSTMDKTSFESR